jgi:hypothetical protein
MTDADSVNAAMKQKGEKDGGEDESEEEGQSSECISQYSVLTLLDYMGQTGIECSDLTAARSICTAMRKSLNSS